MKGVTLKDLVAFIKFTNELNEMKLSLRIILRFLISWTVWYCLFRLRRVGGKGSFVLESWNLIQTETEGIAGDIKTAFQEEVWVTYRFRPQQYCYGTRLCNLGKVQSSKRNGIPGPSPEVPLHLDIKQDKNYQKKNWEKMDCEEDENWKMS